MDYIAAFQLWKIQPPLYLDRLLLISAGHELRLGDESHWFPWPFLTPEEMIDAFPIRSDWEIPDHFVPIAGDFHELLCIDASTEGNEIVVLNDSREEVARFHTIEELEACMHVIEESSTSLGVIESKSWLNF